jgi:hypothetical protein
MPIRKEVCLDAKPVADGPLDWEGSVVDVRLDTFNRHPPIYLAVLEKRRVSPPRLARH